jgi:hypothetical protein
MPALELVAGLLLIVGLLLAQAGALVALAWVVLVAIRRVPLIGRRHKHAEWETLNVAGASLDGPVDVHGSTRNDQWPSNMKSRDNRGEGSR